MRSFSFLFVSSILLSLLVTIPLFVSADPTNVVYLDCGSAGKTVAPIKVSLTNSWGQSFSTALNPVSSQPGINKFTLALDAHAELVSLDFSSMSSSYDYSVSISISPMNWKCVGGGGDHGCGYLHSNGFLYYVGEQSTQTILLSWKNAECSTLIAATRGKIAPPLLSTLTAENQAFTDLVLTPAFAPATFAYSVAIPNFTPSSTYSIYITSTSTNNQEYSVACSLINVPNGDQVSQVVLQPANSKLYTALLTLASTTPSLQVVFSLNKSKYTEGQASTYTLAFTSATKTSQDAPLTVTSFVGSSDNVVLAGSAEAMMSPAPFKVEIVENKP